MFITCLSITLPIILLTLLLICGLLRINEQIEQENANLKKSLDIVQNKLDSICNEVDNILEQYNKKPPPKL